MNVIYLLRYYPTLTETFVYSEIKALVDSGVKITIVAMGPRSDGQFADNLPDVPVITVPRAYWFRLHQSSSLGTEFLERHQRPKDIARYRWLKQQVSNLKPDLIHVHFAGEAAEWGHALTLDLGIPCGITIHAVDMFRPRPAFKELLTHCFIRCISRFAFQQLQAQNPKVQLVYIPCAVNIPSESDPIPVDRLRGLFIGRDMPKKGLSILLDAWKTIPAPHTLTLITQSTKRLPERVVNLGFLPPTQIPAQLNNHNLLILPCQKSADGDMDGIPLVCMEALAHQRPVLSTVLSGIPELVTPEVGWLLEESKLELLSERLKDLCTHLNILEQKGKNGPARLVSGGFTLQAQCRELQIWFHNVTV